MMKSTLDKDGWDKLSQRQGEIVFLIPHPFISSCHLDTPRPPDSTSFSSLRETSWICLSHLCNLCPDSSRVTNQSDGTWFVFTRQPATSLLPLAGRPTQSRMKRAQQRFVTPVGARSLMFRINCYRIDVDTEVAGSENWHDRGDLVGGRRRSAKRKCDMAPYIRNPVTPQRACRKEWMTTAALRSQLPALTPNVLTLGLMFVFDQFVICFSGASCRWWSLKIVGSSPFTVHHQKLWRQMWKSHKLHQKSGFKHLKKHKTMKIKSYCTLKVFLLMLRVPVCVGEDSATTKPKFISENHSYLATKYLFAALD